MKTGSVLRHRAWAGVLALLWLGAALHAGRTAALAVAAERRMTQRTELLRQLHPALERWTSAGWLRVQWLDALQTSEPFAFDAWWQPLAAGLPAPAVRERRAPALEGQASLITLELDWDALALADLGALLERLEPARPPVHVAGLRVDPLREGGRASVMLRLELLAKPSS